VVIAMSHQLLLSPPTTTQHSAAADLYVEYLRTSFFAMQVVVTLETVLPVVWQGATSDGLVVVLTVAPQLVQASIALMCTERPNL
jgi:hypothetical protein